MITHRNIVTSLLLKPLKQCLIDVTSFKLSKLLYSRLVLVKLTNNCGSVFLDRLDGRIYEIKFPTQLFSSFCICRITFPFDAKKTFFYSWLYPYNHVTSLLFTAGVEKYEATSRTEWIAVVIVIFHTWNLCSYLKAYRDCPLRTRKWQYSQNSLLFGKL